MGKEAMECFTDCCLVTLEKYIYDPIKKLKLDTFSNMTKKVTTKLRGRKLSKTLHNSLQLNFPNIQGLRSKCVECESLLESNFPDILALCETNLDDSIDSSNFSVRGYLPII